MARSISKTTTTLVAALVLVGAPTAAQAQDPAPVVPEYAPFDGVNDAIDGYRVPDVETDDYAPGDVPNDATGGYRAPDVEVPTDDAAREALRDAAGELGVTEAELRSAVERLLDEVGEL
jgi:hypothetical protein